MNDAFEAGVRLYHAHRPEQALQEFRRLAEGSGATPEMDYYIGLCLTQMGRYDEALLALEKVVNSSFSFLHTIQARMVLGYIYSVTGRHRLAEFEFARVCDLGLQSSQALAALGFALYAQRKVKDARDTLQKALDLDPKNANALNSLGFILAEEKLDASRAVSLCPAGRGHRTPQPRLPRLPRVGAAPAGRARRGEGLLPQGPRPRARQQGDRGSHARADGEDEERLRALSLRLRHAARRTLPESLIFP